MSERKHSDSTAVPPDKPDQWHDFRRGIALLSMILFALCLTGIGFLLFQLVAGADVPFYGWSFFRFMSFAVPLGVASVYGLGVYRARDNAQAKQRGREMALALVIASALLVVTGIIGDRLS